MKKYQRALKTKLTNCITALHIDCTLFKNGCIHYISFYTFLFIFGKHEEDQESVSAERGPRVWKVQTESL